MLQILNNYIRHTNFFKFQVVKFFDNGDGFNADVTYEKK